MAAITSLSDLVNLLTNGSAQHYNTFIDNRIDAGAATIPVQAQFASLWRYNKTNATGNGEFPPASPGENPTRLTLGALRHNNSTSGKELWLVGIEAVAGTAGTLTMYDRLYHMKGLSGTTTGAQTVGGAVTRNTGGVGNQIWLEVYSTIGTTSTTVTASYTNQDGVSKTTLSTTFGGTGIREIDRVIRLPLADGDTGVRSVETVSLAATTGTAGDFGVTIAKPLTRVHCEGAATGGFRDLLGGMPSMVTIADDACLALLWHAGTPSAPRIDFSYHAVEK